MITHRYTVLCDDVRQEVAGKYILIGVYTPNVCVPEVPFPMAGLVFYTVCATKAAGVEVDFSFRLMAGAQKLAAGAGHVALTTVGEFAVPIPIRPFVLPVFGEYTFVLDLAGASAIEHTFAVTPSPAGAAAPATVPTVQ